MKKENTKSTAKKDAAAKPAVRRGRRPAAAKAEAAPAVPAIVKTDVAPAVPAAPKPTVRRVKFSIQAASDLPVYVAGTFNDWNPEGIPMKEKDGVYTATVSLEPGVYEYKFIVNGFWTMDPDPSREWRANGLGTLNSVITVA